MFRKIERIIIICYYLYEISETPRVTINVSKRIYKIYDNNISVPGLGMADVTEKAMGAKLGEIGIASPEDVSTAAAALEAQKEWA